jgi:hypothetical protein
VSKKILCVCIVCGKPFEKYFSDLARGKGKFCSRICSAQVSPGRSKGPNEHWEVAPGVTCIALNHGKFALIDTVDYPKVSAYRWHAIRSNVKHTKRFYATANVAIAGRTHVTLQMHRVILDASREVEIDHINGNGLDNSSLLGPLNIKLATTRQNQQNRHHSKTSAFPGVNWDRHAQKWEARVKVDNRRIRLGRFDDEELAGTVYQKACDDIAGGRFIPPG